MNSIGVICGLKSEAEAVRASLDGSKIRIGVSGANAERAETIARDFCQKGAAAIVSVGVSGGLEPSLHPGDLVIGDQVITEDADGCYCSDAMLTAAAKTLLADRPITIAALFGSDAIIQSVEHKMALFSRYGAIAVDMESHGAARAAAEFSTPFIAIRAIADPACRALPKAALTAVAEDGSTRVFSTLLEMTKAPREIPALLQLGSDSAKALKTLRSDLGPLFASFFLALDL